MKDKDDISNAPMADDDLKKMKPLNEVLPDLGQKLKSGPGRPKINAPQEHIGLRLDADIVNWLRSHKGYNAIVNQTLRDKMDGKR